ncbi:MAG: ribosomal-processing cysteine protease Prp [Spirochaetes bacterium]|nr:ribosomal-processing cysteine protease Prp [Spirochaetota bacterium]
MINLELKIDKKLIIRELKINGHSGFDVKNKDIVCSAVSILVYSVILTLKKYNDIRFDLIDNNEELNLKINGLNEDIEAELRGMSLMFVNGIKLLEKNYTDNLKLTLI